MARVSIKDFGIKFTLDKRRDATIKQVVLKAFYRSKRQEFWALRNINLELNEGDILGIVGPNGVGKSTLLRAITGIYGADEGTIEVDGTVSLLAIGAGFVPDLTGIENIFLNGSVFGFSEAKINALVPKVAEFADIGDFIYQPVRIYSSGMVSRLGFAIAVNLDPDILLIDEILAVGDKGFQEKCQVAIKELISHPGRIVVIVSHNMAQIELLCNRVFRLERKLEQST